MHEQALKGKWREIQGRIRTWWGNLTDDDVAKIDGKLETLLGLLQQRYGYTRERAEQEVEKHLREFEAMPSGEMRS
ncbi:MAG TPA: CsbD family protein [Anaerolineales bacterium]